MFSHEDSRIFVLLSGVDLAPDGLRIALDRPDDPLLAGVVDLTPYRYWLDVVTARPGAEVLAHYQLEPTASGREILRRAGVPESFPALVRASRRPLRLYGAGDWSDNAVWRGSAKLAGWPELRQIGNLARRTRGQEAFFWEVYVPLLENAFKQVAAAVADQAGASSSSAR